MARAAAGDRARPQRRPTLAEVKKMINVVPDADIKKFLAAELRGDGDMLERFGALARRSLASSRGADYRAKVEMALDKASGGGIITHHTGYVSLASIIKDAKNRERAGDYEEAARMYGQISEAVIDYLPRIYSVASRFRGYVSKCILAVGECAKKSGDAGVRMRIVRYLVDRALVDSDGAWLDEYWMALDSACQTRGDKEGMLEMIDGSLSAGPPAGMGSDADVWGKYMREYADDVRGRLDGEGGPAGG